MNTKALADVIGVGTRALERTARGAAHAALLMLPEGPRREVLDAAILDLASRAKPALVSHLVLMLLAALASGIARKHPLAIGLSLVLAGLFGLLRVRLANRPRTTLSWWHQYSVWTVALSLEWGIIVFLVTREYGLHETSLVYWMAAAGIAAGGAASLKPALGLAIAFDFTLLAPIGVACLVAPGGGLALAGIVATFFLLLLALARETSKAFWNAKISAAVVQVRTNELEIFHQTTSRDHAIAEVVFRNILDRSTFDLGSLRVHWSSVERFNGDLAMVLPVDGRRLRFFVGDFTGHGLGAAVGALPVADIFFATTRRGVPLEVMLREMNAKLRLAMPRGIFLSALAGELDTVSGRLVYWNSGLPEGYLLGKDGTARQRLRSRRVPIGILANDQFVDSLDALELERGDHLFLCTDGVVETTGPAGEIFGHAGLERALARQADTGFWSTALDEALERHRGGTTLHDDTTYLELRYDDQLATELERRGGSAATRPWRSEIFELQFDPERLKSEDPLADVRSFIESHVPSQREASIANNVVAELFLNALDHGLLRLSSAMKDDPDGMLAYFNMREQRLAALEDGLIDVRISVNHSREGCSLNVRVTDNGTGFQIAEHLANDPLCNRSAKHGRGIAVVKHFCRKAIWLDGGRMAEAELVILPKKEDAA